MTDELKNYFYGQATHYNHPGWYFDVIVDNFEDLNSQMSIRPGRFVLVRNDGAIFMRTGNNGIFVLPYLVLEQEDSKRYFYQDKYHLSGEEVTFEQSDIDNDTDVFEVWLQKKCPDLTIDEKSELIDQLQVSVGYRFISYTFPNVQIWKGGTGNLVVDFQNTDFTVTDEMDEEILDIFISDE